MLFNKESDLVKFYLPFVEESQIVTNNEKKYCNKLCYNSIYNSRFANSIYIFVSLLDLLRQKITCFILQGNFKRHTPLSKRFKSNPFIH